LVAVADVAELESTEVASAKLAVNAKTDEHQLAYSFPSDEGELEVLKCP
jgi:hypothetical protein